MVSISRTASGSTDFVELVALLDAELAIRDGAEHAYYAKFNKIDSLQHVVVAYSEGVAVGCGAIKPFGDRAAEVKRMFVRPEHRGKRIAGEILRELEAWASELGFDECVLETGHGQYIGMDNSVCMKKTLG
jgi:putative acetyltransferase